MDKRQGRISTKMIILIPVFILGIVSIISNVAAVGNIQRVNSNARQIADGYMSCISELADIQNDPGTPPALSVWHGCRPPA